MRGGARSVRECRGGCGKGVERNGSEGEKWEDGGDKNRSAWQYRDVSGKGVKRLREKWGKKWN